MSRNRDKAMFSKLCKLDVAVKDKLAKHKIKKIIGKSSIIEWLGEDGITALHIAQDERLIEATKLLLSYGVDFTLKNSLGSTALHEAMERAYKYETYTAFSLMGATHDFADLILSAHIKSKNSNNPCNKNGISHFHAACTVDSVEGVKFFLDHGVSVEQAIDVNYSLLPGYTALHIAVEYCNVKIVPVLLQHNADVYAKNSEGLNPVHMCVKQKVELCKYMLSHSESINELVKKKLEMSDQILYLMLQKYSPIDGIGLSHLHMACVMANSSFANRLLEQPMNIDHSLNMDSPLFAGYTALHFALKCNIDTVKLLFAKGANMHLKNSYGLTPLDLCLQQFNIEQLHSVLSCHPVWKDILVDNETRLTDLIYASKELNQFNSFPQNIRLNVEKTLILSNSPLWPGLSWPDTLLHLVIALTNREDCYPKIIELLVNVGCQIDAQDERGETALHTAVKFRNVGAVTALIEAGADINVVDENGKTAFAYAHGKFTDRGDSLDHLQKQIIGILLEQVLISLYFHLHVCQINKDLRTKYVNGHLWRPRGNKSLFDELNEAKDMKIRESLTLQSFLSEKTIAFYPYTSLSNRAAIRASVKSIDNQILKPVVNLVFRKAEMRIDLVTNATGSLRILSDSPVPDLCSRIIFECLNNADLENLIAAAFEEV